MSDSQIKPAEFRLADPAKFARNMAKAFEHASHIAHLLADRPNAASTEAEAQVLPVETVAKTLGAVAQSYMADPQRFMDAQMRLMGGYSELWQNTWRRFLGETLQPVAAPEKGDKRFNDKDWQENSFFDFIKQFYLISTRWAIETVRNAEGVDERTRHKARFYVEQIANAVSPTNFALTNPEVLRTTLATNGENLLEGLKNLEEDMKTPDGRLKIRQTDVGAFEIGKNVAITPGKVDFPERHLRAHPVRAGHGAGLRHPSADRAAMDQQVLHSRPDPEKVVRALGDRAGAHGLRRVLGQSGRAAERQDVLRLHARGFLTAIDAVQDATGAEKVNTIGYCVGGTLVAGSLGYMAAQGDHGSIRPLSSPRKSISRRPETCSSTSTRSRSNGSRDAWPRRAISPAAAWPMPSICCAPTT